MSNEFAHRLSQVLATGFFVTLSDAVLKGTGLLLAACLLQWLLRRRAAALRHAIWTTTLGLLLALPILSAALPGWHVLPDWLRTEWDDQPVVPGTTAVDTSISPALSVTSGIENGGPAASAHSGFIEPVGGEALSTYPISTAVAGQILPESMNAVQAPVKVAAQPSRRAAIRNGILATWLLGLAVCVLRMALSAWALCRCRWRANQVVTGPLSQEFFQLGSELRLRRMPRLLLGDDRAMPMAWGVLRSCVLVPRDSEQWPASQRRAVLLHELGHIVRRDPLWQLLVQAAQAVYWFHPLVWLAAWRVHVERERACDDLVLNRGVAAPDYARHLLNVVSGGQLRRIGPAIGVAMATSRRLEGRVRSIMDDARDRRPLTARLLALSFAACLAVGLPLAMIRGKEPAKDSDSAGIVTSAADDDSLPSTTGAEKRTGLSSPEEITRRVRELIYIIRQSRVNSREDEWLGAIRDLTEIGKPAVPELVAELDRTDREQTLRAVCLALRGINDPRAVPALIRNLPRTLRPSRNSGTVLFVPDRDLHEFLKPLQPADVSDNPFPFWERSFVWRTSVEELLDALQKLTNHSEAGDGDKDTLRTVQLKGSPAEQAEQRQAFLARQKAWEGWWAEHWNQFATADELRAVEAAQTTGDPVNDAGLARFGPLFPTGPEIRLSAVREVELGDSEYWDAPSHVDFETGRVLKYLEGAAQAPPSQGPVNEVDARWNWIIANGIDANGRWGTDLHLWRIANERWDRIESEVQRGTPLELGVESGPGFGDASLPFGAEQKPASYLLTTRAGGRGVLQWFPRDTQTGNYRIRYRLWTTAGAIKSGEPAAPAAGLRDGPLGPIVTITLQTPGRGKSFVANLSTGQAMTPPDTVVPPDADGQFDYRNNEHFAAWCREQGADVAAQVVHYAAPGRASGRGQRVRVSGIDWTARLVRPTTFEHFDAADVQDILNRFAGSDEQVVISSGVNQPTTCVIRTRNARIGVLRITEQADEAGSITFQYRLAAVSPAAPPATGNSKGHQPVPPQKPEAAAPPAADATAVSGNYVFPIDVSGRALDADGKPIAGAVIFLGSQRSDWKRVSETTTDEQGRYVFLQVPLPIERATTNSGRDTGAFEVFGFADGYAIAWRPKKTFFPDPEARNRNVIEDNPDDPPTWFVAGDRIELDLTFERPVSISGRILDDRGRPIPETSLDIRYADVEWDRPNYDSIQFHGALTSLNERETVPPEFKRRQADADGRFTYTGLRPDCRYQVWVRPPGFPLKRIWIVTKPGKTRDDNGLPIYGDGMELTFATPIDVPIRVIYDDTGEPAPKVHVHLGRADASASQSTNDQGEITLRIPPGEHRLDLDPAHGTPYLESDGTLDVPANTPDEPIVVRLKRGTMVEVVVVDVATGKGVPDVDLWHEAEYPQPIGLPAARARRVYEFRSWEVETRIAHVNRPRTDAGGHLRAVFPPGKHRIGIGLESYPQGSRVVESNGQEIDCKAGETVTVTFHLQPR